MARKPNKKTPRHKPPTIGQRRRAEVRAAAKDQGKSIRFLPSNKLDVRVDKAQALWQQGKFDEAIWFYERALARDSQNPVLLVDMARAYAMRFRFADAETLIAQANTLYPDNARLQRLLGESYVQVQQYDRAIACYRRSLELEPDFPKRPQVLLELSKMHERLHQLEDARQCAEDALALNPDLSEAKYELATIDRRTGNLKAAELAWRNLVEANSAPWLIVADSHYQLASLHDKAGRYDESFDELTRAKAILTRNAREFLEDAWLIGRTSGKSIAAAKPEHFERWVASIADLVPLNGELALLTSHPRSGTTLLEQVLDSHPGAISADELQIMSGMIYVPMGQRHASEDSVPQVLDRLPVDEVNQARQLYWSCMESALREPINGRVLIDKNPELTMLLPLVGRVFPDMKVLFALRDPRDVVISCFTQQLPLNRVSVHYLTLEGTVKKYAKSMRAWLKLRDLLKNPWIEIRYEDMVSDLEGQARKALDFLGLSWDERVLEFHRRAQTKHIHSPTYEAVTRPVYSSSIGRWRNYAKHLEPYQAILQPYVEAFGYA